MAILSSSPLVVFLFSQQEKVVCLSIIIGWLFSLPSVN